MGCDRGRIVLLTSRAAEAVVRHFAKGHPCVEVVVLPVNVAAFLTASSLERIIESRPQLAERLRGASLIVAPGLVRGDLTGLSEALGVPVVKGTKSATGIPALLSHIERGGELSPREPADYVIEGGKPRGAPRGSPSVRIGPVEVALRGPPLTLASEVPPDRDPRDEAPRLVGEGAEIVVVGSAIDDPPEVLEGRVKEALESVPSDVAVIAEAPTPAHARLALQAGAHGVACTPEVAHKLEPLEGRAVIVADRSLDDLFLAVETLKSRGAVALADPVLDIPLVGFARSISRYLEAVERIAAPLVFSAANAATEVEADTHGVHALLAAVAVEVGASVYYVVEDRYKDMHSTAEAREAIMLAEKAYETGLTERGLPSRLLVVKQPDPPPPPRLPPGERVGWIPPRLDRAGYFLVDVDHRRGVIVAEFRPTRGSPVRVEGESGLALARALLSRAPVALEHAAYLGYELCKAELALRLGLTYTQDDPLIQPPWRRGGRGEEG